MSTITESAASALQLLIPPDPVLLSIVARSLGVSATACAIGCALGLLFGAWLGVARFAGREAINTLTNTLLAIPAVVVGLLVYLHLSRSGPLGFLGLLYTPTAMIIAQTILIAPIVAALSRQVLEDLHAEYAEQFRSLCLTRLQTVQALLWDARYSLLTVGLAGFGRAVAEVGAVIIVGGNIDHLTRVMTTAIALETSKGDLGLALALGLILLVVALGVNAIVHSVRMTAARQAYV